MLNLLLPFMRSLRRDAIIHKELNDIIHGAAMDTFKNALVSAPVLRIFDSSRTIQICLDACKVD